jgi:hypothetical protein
MGCATRLALCGMDGQDQDNIAVPSMAAPPPDRSSWDDQKYPAAASSAGFSGGYGPGGDPEGWKQATRGAARAQAVATPWLWLPLGLTSLLLVLFVVVVNRQQAQVQRLSDLLTRVQTLEQSRAVERTAVLEQQLRSMLTRLQSLEKGGQGQEKLAAQLQTLQEELRQLRRDPQSLSIPLQDQPSAEQEPRSSRPPAVPLLSP